MDPVPEPVGRDVNTEDHRKEHQVRTVSHLEVELGSLDAVVLRLRSPENVRDFAFVLSPPAAARLARKLGTAVEEYLHGSPEVEW